LSHKPIMTQDIAHPLSVRHLLDIASLSKNDILLILERAKSYKAALEIGKNTQSVLSGKVIMVLFAENSTRTKVSFEMAALRLGAQVIVWDEKTSSSSKGETFEDTIANLNAIGPDAIVIRHHEYGAPQKVAGMVSCPVINAGDSWREHPTQALLDALTLLERKGSLEGLTVAICGDVAHSRVANSNMLLLEKMGANVHLIAPPELQPQKTHAGNVKMFDRLEDGLPGCDAVMMLRIQKERMHQAMIPHDPTYFQHYGLTKERLSLAKPEALVLHPGPINRGVEIADDVADDKGRSVILQQASNGVPIRMAVLDLLVGRQ
jgi:aspartate carbamoyltransferase catalytic subunit